MDFFKIFKQKSSETEEVEEVESDTSTSNAAVVNPEEQKLLFRAAYGGQCGACTFAKLITSSKDSHFIMCSHPQLPKYQGQPVLNCNFVEFKEATTS